jgi:hypothetical protein
VLHVVHYAAARRWLSFGALSCACSQRTGRLQRHGARDADIDRPADSLDRRRPASPVPELPREPALGHAAELERLDDRAGLAVEHDRRSREARERQRSDQCRAVNKGNYTAAVVTLDYSDALIIADDGTQTGVTLKPVGPTGSPLGQVTVTLNLDGADPLTVSSKEASRLALNFELTASNVIDFTAGTVTVTPMILASALPIDAKTVRVRGQLSGSSTSSSTTSGSNPVTTTSLVYTTGITPFDTLSAGAGSLQGMADRSRNL